MEKCDQFVDWELKQPIPHEMESDQHRYQDKIVALIWVHLQYPIEDKSPTQNMVIQKYDMLMDQWTPYQRWRKLPHNFGHLSIEITDWDIMPLLWVQKATSSLIYSLANVI